MSKLQDPRLERKAQIVAEQMLKAYKLSDESIGKSVESDEQYLKQCLKSAREYVFRQNIGR